MAPQDSHRWDMLMQAGHQTQAWRLREFFESDNRRRVYPGSYFAQSAVEIGPRSEHHGPCSVLFSGMELTPHAFLQWFRKSLLRRHVTRIYWLKQITEVEDGGVREKILDPAGVETTATSLVATSSTRAQQDMVVANSAPEVEEAGEAGICDYDDVPGLDAREGLDSGPRSIRDREELLTDICEAWRERRQEGLMQSTSSGLESMVLRLQCTPRELEKFLQVRLLDKVPLLAVGVGLSSFPIPALTLSNQRLVQE